MFGEASKYRPGGRPKSLERYDPKQYGELLILIFELWRKDRMAGKKFGSVRSKIWQGQSAAAHAGGAFMGYGIQVGLKSEKCD